MYIVSVTNIKQKKERALMEEKNELQKEKDELLNKSNPLAIALTVGGLFLFGLLAIILE